MANLVVSVRFTISDAPATGLMADIDLYLYRVNKSTGVWSNVWNGQNPDTEVGGGAYSLLYGSADFETYDYWHYGHYTGASSNVDTPYSYGDGQHDGLTAEAIADIAALNNLSAQQVWEYATRTLSAFGFSVTVGTNNDKSDYSLSSAGIAAIFAHTLKSKAVSGILTNVWAQTVGRFAADDADEPTEIEYYAPDDTLELTHTLTDTTREPS